MNEKFLNSIENSIGSQLVTFGATASVVFGIVLLLVGVYLKKKDNQWWILAVLLGVAAVFTNVMQII
ncbi:hypothetical protein ACYSNW_13580 [Enterococcus sp. LJL99]